ncbi:hypothetical protein NQ176_g1728 [Zarea fungicola]|uniref:Uncharacterized protein n=1 Tax=Zarea fungicola TaxID=93591 RepID=A0ACC1NSS9_9HYPO|nr:hypothetical protein NQ176_g1728 [Lecanicillium fungicola]
MDADFDSILDNYDAGYTDGALQQSEWQPDIQLDQSDLIWSIPATEAGLHDIDHIYAELHKRLDQVAAQAIFLSPTQANQIRQQNRSVIEKLAALENALLDKNSDTDPSLPTSPTRSSSRERRTRAGKRRQTSQPRRRDTTEISSSSPTRVRDYTDQTSRSPCPKNPPISTVNIDSTLARKLLQIGNPETRVQLSEFYAQALTRPCTQPDVNKLILNMGALTDMSSLMRLVVALSLAIESSAFGEQHFRIRKRIALAQFYHAYTIAQNHPEMFLSWCDEHQVQRSFIAPKGSRKSAVQQRFADLIFNHTSQNSMIGLVGSVSGVEDTKRRCSKIQTWRKSGKSWAKFVERFGYGILLLVPACLSDEE